MMGRRQTVTGGQAAGRPHSIPHSSPGPPRCAQETLLCHSRNPPGQPEHRLTAQQHCPALAHAGMDGYSLCSCCWRLLSTPQCPPTLQLWGLSTAGMHGAYQNWCAAVAAGDITRPRTTPVQGQPAITSGSSAQLQLCYAVGPHSPCSQCPVCCAWGQAPAGAPAAETEGCRSTSAPLQTAESTESGSGSSSPTDTGHAHAWEAAGTSRGPHEDALPQGKSEPGSLRESTWQ